MNSQEIYKTLKSLEKNEDFHDLPEIRNAIIKCEDAISCIINTPEKLNPSLAYDLQLIVSSLIDVLKDKKKNLRKSQIASLISIMDHIISGGTKGLIKLPTGAGKTRLFSEIVTGLNLPTVILVPKINLRGQTSEYFDGENVFNIGENGTVINNTRSILKIIKQRKIYNPIIIATYQSFVRLKDDKLLFEEFSKLIKVVIRDEAHRSLGDKTKESLDEMHSYNDVDTTVLQEQDKDLLETDVSDSNEKLELLFTATPKLLDKNVKDTYDEIFGLRLQDLVEEGVLHMPKFIQVSEASIYIGDANIGEKVLNQFATKFVNEKGEYTYSEITDKYLELKKQNNGYMPAVGFCRDIEHAEFIKKYLEERGIRAIRVTSENNKFDKGVNENEAKKMIEANEVDVVVTVTKVSEGWDVPTLRCALNFAPILSEAKYIQGTGRVLRTFDFEEKEEENEQNGVLPKNFAYVIEPKFWNISSGTGNTGEGEKESGGNRGNEIDEVEKKMTTKISGITHLIESGEFDSNYLRDLYGDLDEYGESKLKTLEDFQTYFMENITEFETFGCIFTEKDGKKHVDLNNISNPQKFYLFGYNAKSGLKNINKALGNNDEGIVENIPTAQKVLKQFFESIGYVVVLEKKLKTLEDFQTYFVENITKFEIFGCILSEKNGKKQVDLNNIGNTGKIDLFGSKAKYGLRNLNKALGNNDEGIVENIPTAQKVLKQFFESIGYVVVLEKKQEKIKLKTLEDFQTYFIENRIEFETFGCIFSEKDGKKQVDLNKISNPGKFDLFGSKAISLLRNLNKTLGNKDDGAVKNISTAQKVLKQFFESMGYVIVLEKKQEKIKHETLEDFQTYFMENSTEFGTFGCKLSEKDGKPHIDLNNVGNPQKFDLFGYKARFGIRNLNKALGNKDEGEVKNISTAQKILKQFFESMGYMVDLSKKIK